MTAQLFTSRTVQIVFLIGLMMMTAGILAMNPSFVEHIHQYSFDTYNRLAPRKNRPGVVIVSLDQESVKHLAAWPVGRNIMGDAVERLKEMGASSVSFDMTFTYNDVASSAKNNAKSSRDTPTRNDLYFAEKMAAAGNTVLGFSIVQQERGRPPAPIPDVTYHGAPGGALDPHFFGDRHFMSSFSVLADAAAGNGHVIFIPSDDKVIRFFPLIMSRIDENGRASGLYPSIILEALRVATGPGAGYGVSGTARGGIEKLKVGPYEISTDKKGVFRIYYARPGEGRTYIPLWKVLEKKVDPADIAGKVVLFGGMSDNMGDASMSPFGQRIFGVEAHAEALEQILQGQFLHRTNAMFLGEIAAAFVLSLLVILLAQELNALALALIVAGMSGTMALGGFMAFRHLGWLLDPLAPSLVTGCVFILAAILAALRISIVSHEKSKFLALMSHEIRTPMTGILGMIEFMKDDSLTQEEQAEYVNTISDCSKTLLNTLNDILDVSKLEEGKLEISPVNFDLHEVLGNSAEVLGRMARDKGLTLGVEIDANVPRHMHGDPHRLRQCVMNFMNNAIKFTSRGGVTVHCSYNEDAAPPMVRVEIRDTGIGISDKNMKKLFRGFSQADSSIARKYGGTGLGLSIAKDLMTLMGGRVGVHSTLGEGSTFWLELPWRPLVDTGGEEEETTDIPPLDILLAEDNKVNQQVAMRLLSSKGHKVSIADDGVSVVGMAKEHDFDMILMDMNMPVKSGIEAAREIRALGGRHKDIPIIALTANVVDEYVKQCYQAGMDAHVAKPFSPKELYKTMARFAPGKSGAAPKTPFAAPEAQLEGLNENLKEIGRQLGMSYLNEYIGKALQESGRLLGEAQSAHAVGNADSLSHAVHDLKNAAGMIGLAETSRLAALVESLCRAGEPVALPEIMKILLRDGGREIRKMERSRRPGF